MVPAYAWAGLTSLMVSSVATPLVRTAACARGLVARPRADRWHTRPTALFGGVAIWLAIWVGALPFLWREPAVRGLFLGATAIFLLGVWDDLRSIRPGWKLFGQAMCAFVVPLTGTTTEMLPGYWLNVALAVFWIVLVTNAFNLIDNMDGLAAGIAAICAVVLFGFTHFRDFGALQIMAAAVVGAAFGFLRYNFNPASIFMGDCGSMTLGYVLGAMAVMGNWYKASGISLALAAPVVAFLYPMFDVALVAILRITNGRPIAQGGRDHSSHRLVMLGLSERAAVLVLYGLSLIGSSCSLLLLDANPFRQWMIVGGLALSAVGGGYLLAKAPINGANPTMLAAAKPAGTDGDR